MTVRDGRFSGNSLRIRGGGGQTGYITTPNLGNVPTTCTGFAFKRVAKLVDFRIVALREGDDATEGINRRGRTDGKLDIYLGNSFTGDIGSCAACRRFLAAYRTQGQRGRSGQLRSPGQ